MEEALSIYSNYIVRAINQSGARHAAHFVTRTFSSLYSRHNSLYEAIWHKTFEVQHSPYAVSKFELRRPSKGRENGWEHLSLL